MSRSLKTARTGDIHDEATSYVSLNETEKNRIFMSKIKNDVIFGLYSRCLEDPGAFQDYIESQRENNSQRYALTSFVFLAYRLTRVPTEWEMKECEPLAYGIICSGNHSQFVRNYKDFVRKIGLESLEEHPSGFLPTDSVGEGWMVWNEAFSHLQKKLGPESEVVSAFGKKSKGLEEQLYCFALSQRLRCKQPFVQIGAAGIARYKRSFFTELAEDIKPGGKLHEEFQTFVQKRS